MVDVSVGEVPLRSKVASLHLGTGHLELVLGPGLSAKAAVMQYCCHPTPIMYMVIPWAHDMLNSVSHN